MWRVATALALLSGCMEPQLGDAPFLCNNGLPECPEGYVCVRGGNLAQCVREGVTLPDLDAGRPKPEKALFPDAPQTADDLASRPDTRPADAPTTWDGRATDILPAKDTVPPKQDGWPPHLGCQSNAECAQADPQSRCCCPFPLVPGVWTCLPLCFDPFCI
jgi:hypothetical protein